MEDETDDQMDPPSAMRKITDAASTLNIEEDDESKHQEVEVPSSGLTYSTLLATGSRAIELPPSTAGVTTSLKFTLLENSSSAGVQEPTGNIDDRLLIAEKDSLSSKKKKSSGSKNSASALKGQTGNSTTRSRARRQKEADDS